MRNTFIEKIIENAMIDQSIVLIVGDLGFNVVEPFAKKFPNRFINAGICEQSMASIAAGMAKEGFKVFIYSIANFPTFRCAEKIRNDICYHNLDVTIVSVGGGLSYGSLGYSHHAVQDYGLMRLFPEMTLISPGCPNEVKLSFNYIMDSNSPKYLRLRKSGEKKLNFNSKLLNSGLWNLIEDGRENKVILSTGYGLDIAFKLKKQKKFKEYKIYSCPIWGNKYKNSQELQLDSFDEVVTVEDHLKAGGFGSWIRESIKNPNNHLKLNHLYYNDEIIGKVGSEEYLMNFFSIKISEE